MALARFLRDHVAEVGARVRAEDEAKDAARLRQKPRSATRRNPAVSKAEPNGGSADAFSNLRCCAAVRGSRKPARRAKLSSRRNRGCSVRHGDVRVLSPLAANAKPI